MFWIGSGKRSDVPAWAAEVAAGTGVGRCRRRVGVSFNDTGGPIELITFDSAILGTVAHGIADLSLGVWQSLCPQNPGAPAVLSAVNFMRLRHPQKTRSWVSVLPSQ